MFAETPDGAASALLTLVKKGLISARLSKCRKEPAVKSTKKALWAAMFVIATPLAASAGDYVYADSFGNLVVESDAGYKRIIVGQGDQAKALSDYVAQGQPEVEYSDRRGSYSGGYVLETCQKIGTWITYNVYRPAGAPSSCQ